MAMVSPNVSEILRETCPNCGEVAPLRPSPHQSGDAVCRPCDASGLDFFLWHAHDDDTDPSPDELRAALRARWEIAGLNP